MLPCRDGVGPSWVGLPPGPWPRLIDFMVWRFPALTEAEWTERILCGDVVDAQGGRLQPTQPYKPQGRLCYYRYLPNEVRVAEDETVLFEDELLVAADKPHFLTVTPSGRYLHETLLVRLRKRLGADDLSPLHRIDRETAGVVVFCKQPATRKFYQAMFAQRRVMKTYEAIAPRHDGLAWPVQRSSWMHEDPAMFLQMKERPGAPGERPNAETLIEPFETQGAWARYRLRPSTGQRHQLRVHLAALGLPILGDRIYPVLQPENTDDPANPLRLLARHIEFNDPLTGVLRRFESRRTLAFPEQAGPAKAAGPDPIQEPTP